MDSKQARTEVIRVLSSRFGISNYVMKEIIANTLNTIVQVTMDFGRVQFGSHIFTKKIFDSRKARNPKTGEELIVPSKTKVVYKNKSCIVVGE